MSYTFDDMAVEQMEINKRKRQQFLEDTAHIASELAAATPAILWWYGVEGSLKLSEHITHHMLDIFFIPKAAPDYSEDIGTAYLEADGKIKRIEVVNPWDTHPISGMSWYISIDEVKIIFTLATGGAL